MDFKTKGRLGKIGVGLLVSCVFSAPLIGILVGNAQDRAYREANAEVYDYMLHTDSGKMLKFPVNKSPIEVAIKDMSKEDRQDVVEAINAFDNVSTNINYKILDKDDCKINAKIVIENGSRSETELGVTNLQFNNNTGLIDYPVHINIDLDACHNVFNEKGENAVTAVTKHELAHSLGFADLYGEEHINESLMYYKLEVVEDYTDSDKYRIRKVYGGTAENVNYDISFDDEKLNQNQTNLNKNKLSNKPIAEIYEPKYMVVQKQNEIVIPKKQEQFEQEREM